MSLTVSEPATLLWDLVEMSAMRCIDMLNVFSTHIRPGTKVQLIHKQQ